MPTGRSISFLMFCFVFLAPTASCSSRPQRADAEVPVLELPVYDQSASRLFDDSLSPEVFGLKVDRTPPEKDALLAERSQAADHVLRVKLRTIREERSDDAARYKIALEPRGAPILGTPMDGEFELTVGRASPSLSMLRSMSVEVVGSEFVLLLKRYQLDGEQVLHFRGEPADEPVIAAIVAASTPSISP